MQKTLSRFPEKSFFSRKCRRSILLLLNAFECLRRDKLNFATWKSAGWCWQRYIDLQFWNAATMQKNLSRFQDKSSFSRKCRRSISSPFGECVSFCKQPNQAESLFEQLAVLTLIFQLSLWLDQTLSCEMSQWENESGLGFKSSHADISDSTHPAFNLVESLSIESLTELLP